MTITKYRTSLPCLLSVQSHYKEQEPFMIIHVHVCKKTRYMYTVSAYSTYLYCVLRVSH